MITDAALLYHFFYLRETMNTQKFVFMTSATKPTASNPGLSALNTLCLS